VAKISCSYVDEALFTKNEETVAAIGHLVKKEGESAIRVTAKRVLDKFWRYYRTADAESQTEEKVIDALRNQLFATKTEIKQLKQQIDDLENGKIDLECLIQKEKDSHALTRKLVREKDEKLGEAEIVKKKLLEQIAEI